MIKKSPPKVKSPPRHYRSASREPSPRPERRPGRPAKKYVRKALAKRADEEEKVVDSCPHRVFELTENIESFIKDYVGYQSTYNRFSALNGPLVPRASEE